MTYEEDYERHFPKVEINKCEKCGDEYKPAVEGNTFYCEKCIPGKYCGGGWDYEYSPQFFQDA